MQRYFGRLRMRASFRSSGTPYRAILLVICAALLVLAACDSDPTPVPPTTPTPPPRPTPTVPDRPRSGTLNVRLASDKTTKGETWSLNPWFAGFDANIAQVTGLIFSGLTTLDNKMQPQPDLAESWEVSPDGLSITFHLRKDVTWQDGLPFTSQDVVWSYSMLRQISAQDTSMLHLQEWVQSVDAIEPLTSTVRFTLKGPYSPILGDMAFPILPSHILTGTAPADLATNKFNDQPIGTGPFQFDSRIPGQSISLKANEHYFAGGPLIERVVFVVAPDDTIAEGAISDGTLQLAQVPATDAEKLVTANTGIQGGAYDELGYDFIAFNLRSTHVFSDTRLRQAFAYALDKQGLVFSAGGGQYDPIWTDVNKASWAYDAAAPQLNGDAAKAKQLLADAGWTDTNGDGYVDRDGKPLAVSLYVRNDSQVRVTAAQDMVEPLARVGISLTVKPADFTTSILSRLSPTTNPPFDFDLIMLGWTRTSADPDSFALFHSTQIPTQTSSTLLNFPGFEAPEYDDLSFRARATYDYGVRRDLYTRMQGIVSDQLPYYFLWAQKFGVVGSPKLHGAVDFTSPRYMWNINQWWIE